MPDRPAFILATAGHVDHGKSALVRALTGAQPDRLPEEKARGMTIELGFAHLTLDGFDVGVIDVPGHEDFVRNMVAGVGAIDVALLVVAADDGWMPQTEEHLQILNYLGVRRGVVALTKVDRVDDASRVEACVRERLAASPLAASAIVRTSIPNGTGLDALRAAIVDELKRTTPRVDVGKPRLAVDRAFSLRGVGTVVTGTLVGGTIARGDALVVRPGEATGHARLVQTHGHDVAVGRPGARVAINLPELSVDETIRRGGVVTRPGVGVVTARVDVVIQRTPKATIEPLTTGTRVVVHHGTTTSLATLRTLGIAEGGSQLARLTLEHPMLLLIGDRLLLRDSSQRHTLAGAIVLDASPPARRGRADRERQLAMLTARLTDASLDRVIASQLGRDGAVEIDAIDRAVDASRADVVAAADEGAARGAWRRAGASLIDAARWRSAMAAVAEAVDAHHAAHPEHAGASLTSLRDAAAIGSIFDAVVAELAAGDFERAGAVLRRRTHRAALPPRLQPAGEAIRRLLDARPFDPPSRKEVARDDFSIQALRFLIASAAVVEVGPEVVMTDAAYRDAAARVSMHLHEHDGATVSELKQLLGSSRRVVVPLLERFDRDGVTRRVGDRRVRGPLGDRDVESQRV